NDYMKQGFKNSILVAATTTTILTNLGLPLLTAAFFMFFYATLSAVTPPVALSSYTAAGIAGADMNLTGLHAVRLCLAAFIVPFMFVFSPELLWEGAGITIIRTIITGTIGVICLAVSVHGWHLKGKAHVISRVVLFITALLMIDSGLKTDLIGVVLIIIVYLFEKFRLRKMIKQDETVSLDEESVNTNL
ncbi:MAG: TRAP transporter large permease subunit, partial [Clostridiales bacterium]|nr:TRAP transporter large permease subunit [Clostridiales bacterium]